MFKRVRMISDGVPTGEPLTPEQVRRRRALRLEQTVMHRRREDLGTPYFPFRDAPLKPEQRQLLFQLGGLYPELNELEAGFAALGEDGRRAASERIAGKLANVRRSNFEYLENVPWRTFMGSEAGDYLACDFRRNVRHATADDVVALFGVVVGQSSLVSESIESHVEDGLILAVARRAAELIARDPLVVAGEFIPVRPFSKENLHHQQQLRERRKEMKLRTRGAAGERALLADLARFRAVVGPAGSSPGHWLPVIREGRKRVAQRLFVHSDEACELMQLFHKYSPLLAQRCRPSWEESTRGDELLDDHSLIHAASFDDVANLFASAVRWDEREKGLIADFWVNGLLEAVTARAAALLEERVSRDGPGPRRVPLRRSR